MGTHNNGTIDYRECPATRKIAHGQGRPKLCPSKMSSELSTASPDCDASPQIGDESRWTRLIANLSKILGSRAECFPKWTTTTAQSSQKHPGRLRHLLRGDL